MMQRCARFSFLLLPALALLWSGDGSAWTVRQLNLADMSQRAGSIFRGQLAAATPGTVQVGGATLPTVTYRFAIEEAFRGTFQTVKGITYTEITMVGSKRRWRDVGGLRHFSILPELPKLRVGGSYVVFATRPSSVGLSTTVGLGQGAFQLFDNGKATMAVNAVKNRGLFRGMAVQGAPTSGPIRYSVLANHIRRLVPQP